ncbi:anaphase-promoting complex subunit 5 [Kribbella sp. VKM Ac-2569]|nr:anaphase-promoting complex subunit 5 [Kribbella sp. VKM Ac-2569]
MVGGAAALLSITGWFAGYTQGGWWPGFGGTVGAIGGLVAGTIWSRVDQRRLEKREAVRARSEALDLIPLSLVTEPRSIAQLAPSQALLAEVLTARAALPLWGRSRELNVLRTWLADQDGPQLCLMWGPPGIGKTRLALEFAASPPDGWLAGRLRTAREASSVAAILACGEPTVVVVETGGWRSGLLPFLEDAARASGSQLKILLIARNLAWLPYLKSQLAETSAAIVTDAAQLHVEPVGSGDDLLRWYRHARQVFASDQATGQFASSRPAHPLQPGTSMGELLARALVAAREPSKQGAGSVGVSDGTSLDLDEVVRVLAEHERRQWPEPVDVAIPGDLRDRAVAALILVPTIDESDAASVLSRLPDLRDAAQHRLREIARYVRTIYPGPDRMWIEVPNAELVVAGLIGAVTGDRALWSEVTGALRPEQLSSVIALVNNNIAAVHDGSALLADLFARSGLSAALRPTVEAVLSTVPRLSEPDAILAYLIQQGEISQVELSRLGDVVGEGWKMPRAYVELLRRQVDKSRAEARPGDLSQTLVLLGAGLERLGRTQEAVDAYSEAVTVARQPVVEPSEGLELPLAFALTSLSTALPGIGRHEGAIEVATEALQLYRQLASQQVEGAKDGLSHALINLAPHLRAVGRDDEALAACEEAVRIARELITAERGAHHALLGRATDRLCIALCSVGRYDEGAAAASEAVELYQQLMADRPEDHEGNVAQSLLELGVTMTRIGRYAESLMANEEAVRLFRRLAAELPGTYEGNLALALTNLGIAQERLGKYPDLLIIGKESVRISRRLAAADPHAYQGQLAHAVMSLAVGYGRTGSYETSVTLNREAVQILQQIATGEPDELQSDLALALRNLATNLAKAGQPEEAVSYLQQSVELFRQLTATNAEVYQGDLGTVLVSLGGVIGFSGAPEAGLALATEALDVLQAPAAAQPAEYRDTLNSARRLARDLLQMLGREEEIMTRDLPRSDGSDGAADRTSK